MNGARRRRTTRRLIRRAYWGHVRATERQLARHRPDRLISGNPRGNVSADTGPWI